MTMTLHSLALQTVDRHNSRTFQKEEGFIWKKKRQYMQWIDTVGSTSYNMNASHLQHCWMIFPTPLRYDMVNVAEMAIWPSSGQVVKPNFKSDNWDEIYSWQIKWYSWGKGPVMRLQWFILYLTFFISRHDNHFCWLGERSRKRSTNMRWCATKRWPLERWPLE